MAFIKDILTKHDLSTDEEERLLKPSGFHCPDCAEPMSQGEYEAGGLCADCYVDQCGSY